MKGEFNQECNITSCQKPNSAIWFNHSTRKHYCRSCAMILNIENKEDLDIFGHDLCTLEEKEIGLTINESLEQDKAIMFHALKEYGGIEEIIKSGREKRNERRKQDRAKKGK